MNKAILIVICDFLVSAMLTMMTGMVPGHTGGTGVGLDESTTKVLLSELNKRQLELENLRARLRETLTEEINSADQAKLDQLTAELAENIARQRKLRAALAATPENTGIADADKLRKILDSEQIKRLELEIKLDDASKDIASKNKQIENVSTQLRDKSRDYAVQGRELSRTRDVLAKTSEALVDVTRENAKNKADLARSETRREIVEQQAEKNAAALADTRKELAQTGKELSDERREHSKTSADLARKDTEVRERSRELRVAQDDLRKLNAAHTRTEGQLGALQIRYAETTGKLAVKEQDNASLKDEVSRILRELHVADLRHREAETKVKMMQETLQNTVKELSSNQQELAKSQQTNARLDATVEAMKKAAAASAAPNKHKVFENYAKAAVRIEASVSEKAFMGDRTGRTVSFYPLVEFDGRVLLTGALNRFAGDWDKVLDFRDVTQVSMMVSPPFSKSGNIRNQLAGPMLSNKIHPHLAAFQYSDKNCIPLQVISAKRLQERGVEELFLFKCSGFEANAKLDGRVSLVMDMEKPSLFIRNAGRANNELTAEEGDIIMTIHGEFVGVVSEREKVDQVDGARVPLFTGTNIWDNSEVVPLNKKSGDTYYSSFGNKMQQIRKKVKAGYSRY